jgi:uncharacterized OB-fold protein
MTSQLKTTTNHQGEFCLLVSQCNACGQYHFPITKNCLCCQSTHISERALSTIGRLWSWTSQNYLPKTPPFADMSLIKQFTPFLLGYVEFSEGIRIIGRLTNITQDQLMIDMKMKIVPFEYVHNDTGECIQAFSFEPISLECQV